MARELALIIGVEPKSVNTSTTEIEQVMRRLEGSGYKLRDRPALDAMTAQRDQHMSCVNALADHLGKPTAVLIRQN